MTNQRILIEIDLDENSGFDVQRAAAILSELGPRIAVLGTVEDQWLRDKHHNIVGVLKVHTQEVRLVTVERAAV